MVHKYNLYNYEELANCPYLLNIVSFLAFFQHALDYIFIDTGNTSIFSDISSASVYVYYESFFTGKANP